MTWWPQKFLPNTSFSYHKQSKPAPSLCGSAWLWAADAATDATAAATVH